MSHQVYLNNHQLQLLKWAEMFLLKNSHLILALEPIKYEMLSATQKLITSNPRLLETLNDNEQAVIKYLELKALKEDIEIYIEMQSDIKHAAEASRLMNENFKKLNNLKKELSIEVVTQEVITPVNNLIYLTTGNGTNIIERDFKDIAPEYYNDFKELLECLRLGELGLDCERGKSLRGDRLKDCYEIKHEQFRIMYCMIGYNSLLILMAKYKRDNDLTDLKVRLDTHQYLIDELKDAFKHDEAFRNVIIEEHKVIDQTLVEYLTNNARKRNCRS